MKIDLWLWGNTIPSDDITKLLGIEPDQALLRGQSNKELVIPRQNIWSINSYQNRKSIGEQWESIIRRFGDKWTQFVDISRNGTVKIAVVIDATGSLPAIVIPPAMTRAAAELNAEMDIAYYQ